jgi:ribosomal protein S18 acetylase RimI-like enzyme
MDTAGNQPTETQVGVTLEPAAQSDVDRFQALAAREKVSLKPTAHRTLWFWAPRREGFGGLIEFAPGKWRIRGVFVHVEYRGEGVGTKLTEALIDHAVNDLKAETLEVIAMNPAFYERHSFKKVNEIRAGSWRLVYDAR